MSYIFSVSGVFSNDNCNYAVFFRSLTTDFRQIDRIPLLLYRAIAKKSIDTANPIVGETKRHLRCPASWKNGAKSAREIHRLLKTAVEKPMFAEKYNAKRCVCSFSTLVFHRLWITVVEYPPHPHPIYSGTGRKRPKDGGNCPLAGE